MHVYLKKFVIENSTPAEENHNSSIDGNAEAQSTQSGISWFSMDETNSDGSQPIEYKCRFKNCSRKFGSWFELCSHEDFYHQYQCPKCERGFNTEKKLVVHFHKKHCEQCKPVINRGREAIKRGQAAIKRGKAVIEEAIYNHCIEILSNIEP